MNNTAMPSNGVNPSMVNLTWFARNDAATGQRLQMSWVDLCGLIGTQAPQAPNKGELPLIKLATFKGDHRTNDNTEAVFGVEGDHDAGTMQPDIAAGLLTSTGITALIYTTPSHRPEKPRWRVLCPLSRPITPSERHVLVARLNGVLGGALARESFIVSQAFYIGSVNGGEPVQCWNVAGAYLDNVEGPTPIGPPAPSGSDRKPLGSLPARSFGDAVSVLDSIDPNDLDFNQWIALSAAFRQATTGLVSDDMIRNLWDGWCNLYKKGNGNDRAENERHWQSFNNGTTVGWEYLRDQASSHVRASLIFGGYDFTANLAKQKARAPRTFDATNFFIRASQMEYRPPEYHIKGQVEKDSLAVLFGDPGTGKSFVALDMACCVATGHDFHGHETQQGSVFYIAGEGRNGIKRRVDAWAKHNDIPSHDFPLFISTTAARFLNRESAEIVAAAIDLLATQNGIPRLIVVDTLNRNFGDGDENSQKDMTAFVNVMDELRNRFPDCTIIIVHHSGHGDKDRARGSSVLKGAVDAEYRTTKSDDRIILENFKMKDGPPPKPMEFHLECVDYSAALTYLGEPSGRSSTTLTPIEQLVWNAFKECQGDVVSFSQWRDCFFRKRPTSTNEANQKAFKRAIHRLTDLNFVVTDDGGKNYRHRTR